MPAFAEMLVSQSPPVYGHSLPSTADYKPGSGGGSPGSPGGPAADGGSYFASVGNYYRPVALQLATPPSQTNGGGPPPPFQRQLTPPWGLSPTGPAKGPASPRRSCLVVRPDEPTTPDEPAPASPGAADMMAAAAAAAAVAAAAAATATATTTAAAATAPAPAEGGGPGRSKKKVVFADDHGRQLTQVRVMREPSYMPPIWSLQFLAHVTQGMISPVPQEQWVVDFVQPASDYVRFRQKLDERNVSLENVIIKETEQLIVGTVKVKNLSYHKAVVIRSSCDSWKTHEDTTCTYSVVGNGAVSAYLIYDTFSFKLTLPPKSRRIEFCAAFKCDGVEYWDNNDGRNYSLTNRIAPREDSGAFLSSAVGVYGGSANGRNGTAQTPPGAFASPYVEPGAPLDTWTDMSVESQTGPYCALDCPLERCAARDQPGQPDAATAGPRQQMKPIGLNFSYAPGAPKMAAAAAVSVVTCERRASVGGDSCAHPAGMRPIVPLGRSASSGKLVYIRERHEGEDLLANLLRLRKLMLHQNANT